MEAKATSFERGRLCKAAEGFCQAFATQLPLEQLLKHFSTRHAPVVTEHGLRVLAPFLGSTYEGLDGVEQYFKTISKLLSYTDMQFWDYIVDPEVMKVSVKGRATFTWRNTGQSWPETFVYALVFDENYQVRCYEIWADT